MHTILETCIQSFNNSREYNIYQAPVKGLEKEMKQNSGQIRGLNTHI